MLTFCCVFYFGGVGLLCMLCSFMFYSLFPQLTLHVTFKIDPARQSIMYVESAINKSMMEELTSPTH